MWVLGIEPWSSGLRAVLSTSEPFLQPHIGFAYNATFKVYAQLVFVCVSVTTPAFLFFNKINAVGSLYITLVVVELSVH